MPDATFEGGHLEVNAEKIEKRLNEIWQEASADYRGDMPVAKLCLSNMLVITDGAARLEAENLANEIALIYPSRVFLIVIDELKGAYSAFVRTSCSKDRETGMIRCFEVVELLADISRMHFLPGALRSLLVGSVPVVAVDFRSFQSTPLFDNTILELSDYYYVNAEVVPTGPLQRRYLPLRWYLTLAIRELFGELLGRVNNQDCRAYPKKITLFSVAGVDSYGDLLCGWLLARLQAEKPRQAGNRIIAQYRKYELEIELVEQDDRTNLVRIEFAGESVGTIERTDTSEVRDVIYRAKHDKIVLERASKGMPLSNYVVEAMQDISEFAEYAAVVTALDRIVAV
jgi:hypothetical protein